MGALAEESFDAYGHGRMKSVVDRVNRNARCRCCLWVVALWCAATVIFMLAGYDRVVQSVAVGQMVLKEGSQKYEAWENTPVPVYYKVFAFNLTNPEQFMLGERPRMKECGPYVYLLKESKEEVKFHHNGSVSYRTRPLYYFQPHMSGGSEDDVIISVNIPFVNAADAVKDQGFLRMVIQIAKKIHGFETLRRLTVGELLWGYKSRVIDWARSLQELPYPHQLFGLLVGFNDSMQEPYTMHTGKGDSASMNKILAWNGREKLDFWSGDMCNEIRGTDANGFAPGVGKGDTLYIFNGQLCRAIPLVYNDTVIHSGIAAFRFVPPDDVFSYGRANPQNACFCSGGGCPPNGILDMKPCYWGASVGFSFPHFYKADPKLRHVVRGLKPDEERHRTEFDIYPDLGVPLRVKLRMQMNVMLDRNQALERARHFDVVLPIFWFEVGIDSLPGEVVGLLKLAQNLPPVVKTTSVTLCTALTLIFLMLLLAQTVAAWCGWGSSAQAKRPHTPEHLPAHHHYRQSPPWDFEDMHKPHNGAINGHIGNGFAHGAPSDPPMIDNHTLLPPYRRRDTPDGKPDDDEGEDHPDGDGVPPPYSPGPQQRTPSTVSVEVHTTASDDEIAELPLDPSAPPPPAVTQAPNGQLSDPVITQVIPLHLSPPDYTTAMQEAPLCDDSDDIDKKPIPPSPEPVASSPEPTELNPEADPAPSVLGPAKAPLAKIEDTRVDSSSGPSTPPTPPSPTCSPSRSPMSTFKPERTTRTPPSPATPSTPSTPPELRPELFGEMRPDIDLASRPDLDIPSLLSRPPRSPRSPRSRSPHHSSSPSAPLATSSPHGSNGVAESRRERPPPLESDL